MTAIVVGATARADGKSVLPEIKALAGTWLGGVRTRVSTTKSTLFVKEDGSYEQQGFSSSVGQITLVDGKLRYRSSLSEGRVEFLEQGGDQYLTFIPESGPSLVKGEYQRDKPKK